MFSISHEHQMLQCQSKQLALESLWKPHVEIAPNCPRCASSNTKFCYYNNYSFSQPRYFCKACRRYWTKGGSLRNVPIGGGCRKSRRSNKSARPSSISTATYSSRNFSNDSSNTDEDSITQQDGTTSTTNGPGIDLAVVFAKFLNQDVASEGQEPSSELVLDDQLLEKFSMGDFVDDQLLDKFSMGGFVEDQKVLEQEELMIEEYPQPENPNGFGLHGLLMHDDPVMEDALWSDTTALPSLAWQPTGQLQAFDQTLSCDNWSSSFDLIPNYGVFSMP